MSRFGKLFGKKTNPVPINAVDPVASPTHTAEELRKDPNYIQVFDSYGREMFITKEQWRTGTLPGALKTNWNRPDELYGVLAMAMSDGFFSDVLDAAAHLHRTDTIPSRGATVYGIVLMKIGKLDQAEEVLRSYLKAHGDDSVILTNLAKIQAARNEMHTAEETLWHALVVEPNNDNAFAWHLAIYKEREGEEAKTRELERIATLPGSWRAQLWLARAALNSNNVEKALALYREGLSHAERPAPTDLLVQISGDLGNHGYLVEALQLAEPEFIPKHHGLLVGNNLIKAHLDLGQIEAASNVLEQLYSLRRPDWKQQLSFWDTTLAKARITNNNTNLNTPIAASMLTIEGPIWLKPSSLANSLFPRKSEQCAFVCFLGGSATLPVVPEKIQIQLADQPGRLSRALPLFLAEQVYFHADTIVQTLIPWIAEERGAFMLSGTIWPDADAVKYAKMAQPNSHFVVVTHLISEPPEPSAPLRIQLRLIQTTDAECIATMETSFSLANPQECLAGLSGRLVELLVHHTNIVSGKPPVVYQVPGGVQFSDYLLRLEQLLATRCAGMKDDSPDFLSGKREIVDGMLGLCLSCPTNVVVRILLAETLMVMNRIRPDISAEFGEKVKLLQKQKRLDEPANTIIEQILDEALQSPR